MDNNLTKEELVRLELLKVILSQHPDGSSNALKEVLDPWVKWVLKL